MLRILSFGCAWLTTVTAMAAVTQQDLMPVAASMKVAKGRIMLTNNFTVSVAGHDADERLLHGLARAFKRMEERTGLTFPRTASAGYVMVKDTASASLIIESASPGANIPELGEDESYSLDVLPTQIVLRSPTTLGALHGLETLLQLIQSDSGGWFISSGQIVDHPRFPWRGLMIDVCRHWQPMEVIKRNLDGMSVVKLNVLHLHLTEDQGFRVESKLFPRLHELGSDGHYFTQDQIREIIRYASARGIRVVPEFDIPGHATSWVTSDAELASLPGSYSLERKWGVFDPVLDPTNPKVYAVLEGFLGEMADLFPDAYMHIGGDENNGVQWSNSPKIQAFILEHNLKDNAGLHAYFNRRVHGILSKHGKKLIGWDEILHPDLPAGSVVHSWRGPEGIAAATQLGYGTVLSNGYYIDLCYPTWKHYLNDPAPADAKLNDAQRKLVLGGEATMWSEWVSPETIDSRIWPRTAGIAERLWSPPEVRDVSEMYRRLSIVSHRLEEVGLTHESYIEPALRRLAGDKTTDADLRRLRVFVDLLEPVKEYERGKYQPDATQFTPLTGLVDCVRPDSASARELSAAIDKLIAAPSSESREVLDLVFDRWREVTIQLLGRLPDLSPQLAESESLLRDISESMDAGKKAAEAIQRGNPLDPEAAHQLLEIIQRAGKPRAAVEFPSSGALERLINAAIVETTAGEAGSHR